MGRHRRQLIIRGTPYNTGVPLKPECSRLGRNRFATLASATRLPSMRAPPNSTAASYQTRLHPIRDRRQWEGHRFYDEGEDVWVKRYAIWGKLIARQPAQIAYSIVDAKTADAFMPSVFPPIVANSIGELARLLTLEPATLEATVETFNGAVRPGTLNPSALDDCRTEGLSPNKTHWAQRLDTPPYWAYPLRPGITFTYLGLKVDAHTRVLMSDGQPAANVYAAGEVMAGNILLKGATSLASMTIGTVFGRIAGEEAARHAAR
jgi:tricarballylate dehydrogenase